MPHVCKENYLFEHTGQVIFSKPPRRSKRFPHAIAVTSVRERVIDTAKVHVNVKLDTCGHMDCV